jgi:hypothetical protein
MARVVLHVTVAAVETKQGGASVPDVYANLSQVSASVSDISIVLGVAGSAPIGVNDPGPPRTVAVVRLSPPAAKMLFMSLGQMLNVYEDRFTKIQVPPEFELALQQAAIQLGLFKVTSS